ncbi:chalcone isomerase family protein, partial [Crocinitomicaceae bacterium]|nr:chalcone isomerase family protein [Crocinitomicaceae bacterium]
MKNLLVVLFVGLSAGLFAQDRTVAGETFPAKLDVKGTKLVFNGAGLREKYTLDLYVAALYLPKQTTDANKVINGNEIQAINIKIVSNKVTREKFNETVKEGFAKVTEGKATSTQISKFTGFF